MNVLSVKIPGSIKNSIIIETREGEIELKPGYTFYKNNQAFIFNSLMFDNLGIKIKVIMNEENKIFHKLLKVNEFINIIDGSCLLL